MCNSAQRRVPYNSLNSLGFKIRHTEYLCVVTNSVISVVQYWISTGMIDDIAIKSNNNINYRPQTELREGNAFTGVCLSVGLEVGTHPLGWICPGDGYSRPWGGYVQEVRTHLLVGYSHPAPHPSLDTWDMGYYGIRSTSAGSTHPTGYI